RYVGMHPTSQWIRRGIDIAQRFHRNDTATPDIYTLSLHDALPISPSRSRPACRLKCDREQPRDAGRTAMDRPPCTCGRCFHLCPDRKSTRLNSSHDQISYAVFCLKKKNMLKTLAGRASPQRRRYLL